VAGEIDQHVDGIGTVERFAPVGGSTLLEIPRPGGDCPFSRP